MQDNPAQIKARPPRIILVSGDNITSFPFEDPENIHAGWKFLADCDHLGWPSLKVDQDYYVFAVTEAGR